MGIEDNEHSSQDSAPIAPDQSIADAWRESRIDAGSEVIAYYEPSQDSVLIDQQKGIYGVFDGTGGSDAGDEASGIATRETGRMLSDLEHSEGVEDIQAYLKDVVDEAHWAIREHLDAYEEDITAETTATIMTFWTSPEGQRYGVIANVGDSRAYLLRSDGDLEQLTTDNVSSNASEADVEQEHAFQLADSERTQSQSEDDQKYFKSRHIVYGTLGSAGRAPHPRIVTTVINDGDKIALTTDGVHDNLTASEIGLIMEQASSGQEMSESLSRAAYERSQDSSHARAKRDDISTVGILVR
jgi:serine/threonine protein phosphatase PrpC